MVVNGREGAGRWARPRVVWDWPPSSLVGGLGPRARARLLALGVGRRYAADRVLMGEGEETTFVLVLLGGVVKATGRTQDGREALLAVRRGGDLVGEFAAVDGGPRSATVTTCGPVAARLVRRGDFLRCLRDDPEIGQAVDRAIVAKLRVANAFRVDFTGCDAATRLARVLHQIAMVYGERAGDAVVIRWPLTQPELATLSGAAEPTVHKALRSLREAGVVSTGYRTVRVERLGRLREIAFG
ncbi:cAMP-binding domain of CRP or a regulatory subunit of cAMP-dependent protein kinases [Streptomyces zhaozhouensis]|uniref:cAMP-binding domain of CRP or a regulatory subunit of cAMP-dependent protein kinases n=1 Tax=Streptomyces zhaozhouensis TaxID=1300267 RepID=A0A286DV90_9ACTN|nr:Crp/Fnr family transcriptional regulator [Streptomyces zhaozhouensis]SOD62568.1 cAMP-binding domain of CRP or a regulatory subunit of cAMP-dependent protein kinases [Streptomyces zhaozhouensis]